MVTYIIEVKDLEFAHLKTSLNYPVRLEMWHVISIEGT